MRVVSGKFRGLKLNVPESLEIRPTIDRIKTSVFDTLSTKIRGAKVVDLFCGTGALGIEALSRGADCCFFCDKSLGSINLAKENLAHCDKQNECEKEFINLPFERAIEALKQRALMIDILLLDPPYALENAFDAVKLALSSNICAKDAIIVFETDRKDMLEKIKELGLQFRILEYGNKKVYLIFC